MTSGSSGPTTTKLIEWLITTFLISSKSEIFRFIFFAKFAVPPFPGATKRFLQSLLWLNFQQKVCSLYLHSLRLIYSSI